MPPPPHLQDILGIMSCSDCTSGNWLPGSPKGTEENGAYLAKGSDQEAAKDKAVVVLTDIFGLAISNPKIIADSIAERTGFDVWVPDLFDGMLSTRTRSPDVGCSLNTARPGHPPVAPEVLDSFVPRRVGEKMGLWRWMRFCLTALLHISGFIASRSAVVDSRAKEVSPSMTVHSTG